MVSVDVKCTLSILGGVPSDENSHLQRTRETTAFPRIEQWSLIWETIIGVLWLFNMASNFTTQQCYVLVTNSMLSPKHCHQRCSTGSLLLSMFYWRVYCAYKHCRQRRRERQLISKWVCSMNYKTGHSFAAHWGYWNPASKELHFYSEKYLSQGALHETTAS